MTLSELLELTQSECLADWPDIDFFDYVMGSETEAEYAAALEPDFVAELVRDAMAFRLMVEHDLSVEICSECSEVTVRHQHSEVLAERAFDGDALATTRAAIFEAAEKP